jgi:hypothetical protein
MNLRFVIAAAVGVAIAALVVAGVEAVGHVVYPTPPGLDASNVAQLREYMQTLPLGALFFVLGGWVLATFSGGVVAAMIAATRPYFFSGIVGLFILAGMVANMMLIPHPFWFGVSSIGAVAVAAVAAGGAASRLTNGASRGSSTK